MMKRFLLSLTLLVVIQAHAQLSWQNPNLTGERFHDIQFVSSTVGWVVGDVGTLLKTEDGGDTWIKINPGFCENVSQVHFIDPNEGWIVAEGSLYHTTNGGNNWSFFPVLTYNNISSLDIVSPLVWFLRCEAGLLATTDGGNNWTLKNASVYETFAFANERKGWQITPFGGITYTTDGGETWNPQTSGVSENIMDICIIDSNEVWMGGVSGLIHTTNAGANWTINTPSRTAVGAVLIFISDCHFLDTQVGWAISPIYECVIRTTDGGNSWTKKTVTGEKVFGLDTSNAFVAGDRLLQTIDAANSFTNEQEPVTEADLYSVSFSDNLNGYTVGIGGTVLQTVDGGSNWTTQNTGTISDFNEVFMLNTSNAWVVGNMPDSILYTSNGGANWQVQHTGSGEYLMDIHFIDAQNGWAIGTNGTILNTLDGGQNWTQQTSNTSANLNSVFFTDALNGWVVGEQGAILHSVDGGMVWNAASSGTGVQLSDVYFANQTEGWAVGEVTTILHSSDGGMNWEQQAVAFEGDAFQLNAVRFVDAQRGWATGFTPSIYQTVDGGQTWLPLDCAPEIRNIYGIDFNDANHGWLVGERGAILFSDDIFSALSVETLTDNSFIRIAPNPATDLISVTTDTSLKKIEIRDCNGRLVKETNQMQEIPVEELEPGMYVIYAIGDTSVSMAKFYKL